MSHKIGILEKYPDYEIVIGIEVHVQLNTKSKIFCKSINGPNETPNQNIDPVCAGYPGILPVLNEKVLEYAIKAGLATNCHINEYCEFARKHYFYPDSPRNYQITQADKPICSEGFIFIHDEKGNLKKINLIRIHMEDDAGKIIHSDNQSYVDLNRAGSPLLEIVSYPDISSSFEAKAYLKELHSIVTTLKITTGDMENGAFRADTNISVRKAGEPLGTRCELKNINSFKFIGDAIEYEVERQITLLENGEKIIQQTRLWDTKTKTTHIMREKEDAADYRYFGDPDLPGIQLDKTTIEKINSTLPELPYNKRSRLINDYNLTYDQAFILVDDQEAAIYFENAYKNCNSNLIINWVLREIMSFAKEHKKNLSELSFTANHLAKLINLIEQKVITSKIAQDVFAECVEKGIDPKDYVEKNNLKIQFMSNDQLESIVKKTIAENPDQVAGYKAGRDKLFGFFVGKVMQETKGQADPVEINNLIKKHLI